MTSLICFDFRGSSSRSVFTAPFSDSSHSSSGGGPSTTTAGPASSSLPQGPAADYTSIPLDPTSGWLSSREKRGISNWLYSIKGAL